MPTDTRPCYAPTGPGLYLRADGKIADIRENTTGHNETLCPWFDEKNGYYYQADGSRLRHYKNTTDRLVSPYPEPQSEWVTIVRNDPSTHPTEADAYISGGSVITIDRNGIRDVSHYTSQNAIGHGSAVAWLRVQIPPYTPPAPPKVERREWDGVYTICGLGIQVYQAERGDPGIHVREVLPTDPADLDKMLRTVREVANELDSGHHGDVTNLYARQLAHRLKEALK